MRWLFNNVALLLGSKEAGKSAEFEGLLKEVETAKLDGGALDAVCSKLQALVEGLELPAAVLKEACMPLLPLFRAL